jgi:hypothetical protein
MNNVVFSYVKTDFSTDGYVYHDDGGDVTPKRQSLHEPQSITYHMTEFFIVTAAKTLNLTNNICFIIIFKFVDFNINII